MAIPFESCLTSRGNRMPKLAEYLAEHRQDVHYVTTDFDHARKRHHTDDHIGEATGRIPYRLTVLHASRYSKNVSFQRILVHLQVARAYQRHLVRTLEAGDVLVIPSRPPELIALAVAAGRACGARVVLDITDIWPDAFRDRGPLQYTLFSAYCAPWLRWGLNRVHRFTHCSPSFLNWLRRYNPQADSTFIPLGFDAKRWAECRPRVTVPSQSVAIAYVGALQYQCDVMPVLECLLTRPKFTLSLIGDSGEGDRYPEVAQYIRGHNMANAKLVGRVPSSAVPEMLKQHDLGLVPMISSSMPNKLFDYIAAYLPVLVLGENDCSAFVRQHDVGWAAGFSAEDVGRVLDQIVSGEVTNKSVRMAAMRDQFSRDRLFAQYERVLSTTGISARTGS